VGAQSSYDPRFIKALIGGRAHEHPALPELYGLGPDELDSPRAIKMYEEASPINYVTADDPPVFLYYQEPKGPLPADAKPGDGIHHPQVRRSPERQARRPQDRVACSSTATTTPDNPMAAMYRDMADFFVSHLTPKKGRSKD